MIERIRKKGRHDGEGRKRLCVRRVLVRTGQHQQNAAGGRAGHGALRHRRGRTNGTDPRAGLTRFLVAGVLALAALFVTFLIQ